MGALSSVQSAAQCLSDGSACSAKKVNSSDSNVVTASADTNAATDAYPVQVNQLAQGQQLTSSAQPSATTPIGSGNPTTVNFAFANGNNASITIDDSNNNLEGIASSINNANIGVSADVVSNGPSHELKLTGETGSAQGFDVSAKGNKDVANLLSYLKDGASNGLVQTTAAQDAQGTVNGKAFTSSTNSVTDQAAGLTLNLKGTGSSKVDVTTDTDQATNAVQSFINAYNTAQTTLSNVTKNESSNSTAIQSIKSQLSSAVDTVQRNLNGPYHSLAQVGISRNANGTLTLDSNQFHTALANSGANVAQLFSNNGNGVADQIDNAVSNVIGSSVGIPSTISNPGQEPRRQQAADRNSNVEQIQKSLANKYVGLDVSVGSQQATGEIIASRFAATQVNFNPTTVSSAPGKPPIIDAAQGTTAHAGGNGFASLAVQYNVARGYY